MLVKKRSDRINADACLLQRHAPIPCRGGDARMTLKLEQPILNLRLRYPKHKGPRSEPRQALRQFAAQLPELGAPFETRHHVATERGRRLLNEVEIAAFPRQDKDFP